MAASNTEKIGFNEQVVQFFKDNEANLLSKGLDVKGWITELTTMRVSAVEEMIKQDEMEAASQTQTQVAQTAVDTLYDATSTRLDAAVGVLGKKTEIAKQLSNLRVSVNKQYAKGKKTGGEGGNKS